MKSSYFTLLLIFCNLNFAFSQKELTTQNGRVVILNNDNTWKYKQDSVKTLSEQYDEIAIYAKNELGKDINSYYSSEKKEAKLYVEKQMAARGYLSSNKTLSQQYDGIAIYAKDKLGKDINSYYSSEKKEAILFVEKLMELKGQLSPNQHYLNSMMRWQNTQKINWAKTSTPIIHQKKKKQNCM